MSDTVHVITTLGPTDGPGLVVPAQLGRAVTVGGRWAWMGEPQPGPQSEPLIKFRYVTPETA